MLSHYLPKHVTLTICVLLSDNSTDMIILNICAVKKTGINGLVRDCKEKLENYMTRLKYMLLAYILHVEIPSRIIVMLSQVCIAKSIDYVFINDWGLYR